MSSTGRGAVRHKDDWYETPAWAVDAILPFPYERDDAEGVLEPSAGNGAIVGRLLGRGVPASCITAVELDAARAEQCRATHGVEVHRADFLTWMPPQRFDLAIGNPPFSLALEFIEKARGCADVVCMLLRLNFLGSQKRAAWHRANPCDVYVLPRRPSFTPDGATDSCEYMWAVWGPGRGGRWQVLG